MSERRILGCFLFLHLEVGDGLTMSTTMDGYGLRDAGGVHDNERSLVARRKGAPINAVPRLAVSTPGGSCKGRSECAPNGARVAGHSAVTPPARPSRSYWKPPHVRPC
jgi:hypothetical protein